MEANNVIATLEKRMLVDGFTEMVVDLDRCHGSYLYDSLHEREILDFFSYFASSPLAYNHPAMQEPTFQKKLLRAALHNPTNSDVYTPEYAEFLETFQRVLMPDAFKHVFFVAGGSLAIENAIKAAVDWKVRKNIEAGRTSHHDDQKEKLGSRIMHFDQAFHGRSGYTLSLTNTADPAKYKFFPKFDWPRIPNPKMSFPLNEEALADLRRREQFALDIIHRHLEQNGHDIAAIILEPVQGEGGDNHFRKEFLTSLRTITLENDVMLIFDEVQSGCGLTGMTWAYEHYDFTPDMVCFGKKTQVCGFMATERIDEVHNNVFQESSRINSTWGGNLVDMVRCQRYLEIIEENDLISHAAEMGQFVADGLLNLASETGVMSNIRGKGLMIAFDLPDGAFRDHAFKSMLGENVLMLKSGQRSLRLRPHLDVTKTEINHGLDALGRVLNKVKTKA